MRGSLHHCITGAWSFVQSVVPQSDIQINHIHEFFVELQGERVGGCCRESIDIDHMTIEDNILAHVA